jgi:hypothetical protein
MKSLEFLDPVAMHGQLTGEKPQFALIALY